MNIAFRDSKPFTGEVRTRWTAEDEARLDELTTRKRKAYDEGTEAIRGVLIGIGITDAAGTAKALIPVAAAMRDALAVFDDRTAGEGRR